LHFLLFVARAAGSDPMSIFRGLLEFLHYLHFLLTPSQLLVSDQRC